MAAQPCRECRGRGRQAARRTLQVDVPGGDRRRAAHQALRARPRRRGGRARGRSVRAGRVREDERFVREGEDLITALDVPAPLAALGATLQAPTLDGTAPVEVPQGTQPGEIVTLRGQGMPSLRGARPPGDLKVVMNVVVPRRLSDEQRELIEACRRRSPRRTCARTSRCSPSCAARCAATRRERPGSFAAPRLVPGRSRRGGRDGQGRRRGAPPARRSGHDPARGACSQRGRRAGAGRAARAGALGRGGVRRRVRSSSMRSTAPPASCRCCRICRPRPASALVEISTSEIADDWAERWRDFHRPDHDRLSRSRAL